MGWKPLEDFLKESKAVTFGPTDSRGNSEAERLSGLDDIIVDVMAWAKKTLYEPDDMPMDLQADVAKHLCDMFARQEKWLHPGLTKKGIQHDEEIGRWGWKDPLAMYLLPFWRDVYGPEVTYVHLVRGPENVAIGNLHDKERDLQKAYFGRARWEELTAKFEEEWRHLSAHKSLRDIKKADVIDVLRTTAYWTSVNFEIGAMIKGPLKNHAIVLRAEDLVQPDMDHWRKDANGQVLEKYQAAQKPIQALTTLLQLPRASPTSSRATSTSSVISNDSRCTETNSSFVPIHQSWKCRPASRRRRSNFSATPPTRTSFSRAPVRERRARPSRHRRRGTHARGTQIHPRRLRTRTRGRGRERRRRKHPPHARATAQAHVAARGSNARNIDRPTPSNRAYFENNSSRRERRHFCSKPQRWEGNLSRMSSINCNCNSTPISRRLSPFARRLR